MHSISSSSSMKPLEEMKSLPSLLEERAQACGDRLFLKTVEGEIVTYYDFEKRVRQWMATYKRVGLKRGDTVVTMMPTGPQTIVAWMAAARLGVIEVPINTGYLKNSLVHVVNDSRAECIVADVRYLPRFAEIYPEIGNIRQMIAVGGEVADMPFPVTTPSDVESFEGDSEECRPHDLACIVYTSGTTGPSKGVMVTWRQLFETARWCIPIDSLTASDVWYLPWPLYHISGKLTVYGITLASGTLVTREMFSTQQFWNDIRKFGCTTTMLVGSTVAFLQKQEKSADDRNHTLRNVFACPLPDNSRQFAERFGVRLCSVFNMTETSCPIVVAWDLGPDGSCGRVRPGAQCRVVDENDTEVPDGTVGELVVRSDNPWELMAGYWNRPEATVECWRNQWLHTGDAFKRDAEGNFYFVDRLKHAIRRRGENISSIELESEINQFPPVQESAAIGVPSEFGEEEIKAFVVPRQGQSVDPSALTAFLSARVPKFMVPRYIVVVDQIPKTHTFRAQKEELRKFPLDERTWDSQQHLR